MSTEERLLRLEAAFVTLTDWSRDHDVRIDTFDAKLAALTEKMESLAETQQQLTEAQRQTEANLSALTIIVGDTDKRLDRLAETLDRFIAGQGGQV